MVISGGRWYLGLGIVNAVLGSTDWVLRAQSQKKRPKKTRWGNKSAFFIYCFPIFNLRHQALIKGPTWLILWSGGKEGKLWNHISNNVCPHRMIATGDIIGSTWPVGYQEKERRGQWGNHILPIFMIFQFASVELRVLLMIRRRRGEVKCWNQLSITFHPWFQILQLETSGSHPRSHLTWWWSGEGGEGGGAGGVRDHLGSASDEQLQTTNWISNGNISSCSWNHLVRPTLSNVHTLSESLDFSLWGAATDNQLDFKRKHILGNNHTHGYLHNIKTFFGHFFMNLQESFGSFKNI